MRACHIPYSKRTFSTITKQARAVLLVQNTTTNYWSFHHTLFVAFIIPKWLFLCILHMFYSGFVSIRYLTLAITSKRTFCYKSEPSDVLALTAI